MADQPTMTEFNDSGRGLLERLVALSRHVQREFNEGLASAGRDRDFITAPFTDENMHAAVEYIHGRGETREGAVVAADATDEVTELLVTGIETLNNTNIHPIVINAALRGLPEVFNSGLDTEHINRWVVYGLGRQTLESTFGGTDAAGDPFDAGRYLNTLDAATFGASDLDEVAHRRFSEQSSPDELRTAQTEYFALEGGPGRAVFNALLEHQEQKQPGDYKNRKGFPVIVAAGDADASDSTAGGSQANGGNGAASSGSGTGYVQRIRERVVARPWLYGGLAAAALAVAGLSFLARYGPVYGLGAGSTPVPAHIADGGVADAAYDAATRSHRTDAGSPVVAVAAVPHDAGAGSVQPDARYAAGRKTDAGAGAPAVCSTIDYTNVAASAAALAANPACLEKFLVQYTASQPDGELIVNVAAQADNSPASRVAHCEAGMKQLAMIQWLPALGPKFSGWHDLQRAYVAAGHCDKTAGMTNYDATHPLFRVGAINK